MLKAQPPKNRAVPFQIPLRILTVKIQHGIMQSHRDQARMRMEKTNRLTTRSHKVRDYTHMEKTHRAITRDRKDQALPGELPVWVRVLHKAQAPLVPLQDQEGTNEVYFLISEQVRRHGREFGVSSAL
jgi:hypothetical protein